MCCSVVFSRESACFYITNDDDLHCKQLTDLTVIHTRIGRSVHLLPFLVMSMVIMLNSELVHN